MFVIDEYLDIQLYHRIPTPRRDPVYNTTALLVFRLDFCSN